MAVAQCHGICFACRRSQFNLKSTEPGCMLCEITLPDTLDRHYQSRTMTLQTNGLIHFKAISYLLHFCSVPKVPLNMGGGGESTIGSVSRNLFMVGYIELFIWEEKPLYKKLPSMSFILQFIGTMTWSKSFCVFCKMGTIFRGVLRICSS